MRKISSILLAGAVVALLGGCGDRQEHKPVELMDNGGAVTVKNVVETKPQPAVVETKTPEATPEPTPAATPVAPTEANTDGATTSAAEKAASPNAIIADAVVIKPFERVEVEASLAPLPEAPLPLNEVPSKVQLGELSLDQAVSQARAGFAEAKKAVQPGQFLDEKIYRSTANLLGNYANKLEDDCMDMPKKERFKMLDAVNEAIADLEEASNVKGGQNPGNVQNRLDRAENSLRLAENMARLYDKQVQATKAVQKAAQK